MFLPGENIGEKTARLAKQLRCAGPRLPFPAKS
jgi:hypothetical protein